MIDIPTKNGVIRLKCNGADEEIELLVDVDGGQLTARLDNVSARRLANYLRALCRLQR